MKDFAEFENGYVVNKWIFRVVFLLLLLLMVGSWIVYGFNDRVYLNCPSNKGLCDNPFYHNCDSLRGNDPSVLQARALCEQEFLMPNTVIGEPPSWFMSNYLLFVFGFICGGGLMNHLLYNKKYQRALRRTK